MQRAMLLAGIVSTSLMLGCGEPQPTSPEVECQPAPAELCNGLDDDCDGAIDEGFDLGAPCSAGVGACAATGAMACSADGASALCGAQPGAPAEEQCNGLDDDCDGETDEGLSGCCEPAQTLGCGLELGECHRGTQLCSSERAWGECLDSAGSQARAPGEVAESCNGLDDDCDGSTDEGFGLGETCRVGVGSCAAAGEVVCAADGSGALCNVEASSPSTESCNGLDDDCDGSTDEQAAEAGLPCDGADSDLCSEGATVCSTSGVLVCEEPLVDDAELCNGLDDDCDGETDEASPSLCEPTPHAQTYSCEVDGCSVASCQEGFFDLDNDYANGCESVQP